VLISNYCGGPGVAGTMAVGWCLTCKVGASPVSQTQTTPIPGELSAAPAATHRGHLHGLHGTLRRLHGNQHGPLSTRVPGHNAIPSERAPGFVEL